MKATLAALAMVGAALVAGCATNVGTQAINDFGRFQQARPGETTKPELHSLFGQPHRVQHIGETGESIWSYYQVSERTNPTTYIPILGLATGGSDLSITSADFYFDPDGIFIRSQREQRSRYVNQWLGIVEGLTPEGISAGVQQEMTRLNLPFDAAEARRMAGWVDWSQ